MGVGIAKRSFNGASGKILLTYNKAELLSSGGYIESEGLFWYHCEDCGWNAIERKGYDKSKQAEMETRLVAISYSHEAGHNVMRSTKEYDIPVVLSVQVDQESCVLMSKNAQKSNHSVKETAQEWVHSMSRRRGVCHYSFVWHCIRRPNWSMSQQAVMGA